MVGKACLKTVLTETVQLRVTKAHIKAIWEPRGMELLAGGAHVGPVGCGATKTYNRDLTAA